MFRALKLEAKIVAGGNLSTHSLSPCNRFMMFTQQWMRTFRERRTFPPSFQSTLSAHSDQVPNFCLRMQNLFKRKSVQDNESKLISPSVLSRRRN